MLDHVFLTASIATIIRPQYLVPAESVPTEASLLLAMYAAARTTFSH
jgi:hypothetical protein